MNSRNPNTNKLIGFAILFSGFVLFGIGWRLTKAVGIECILGYVLVVMGLVLCVVSTIWVIKKVRCPHCNALLSLKLSSVNTCPYCGRRTDDI